MRAQAALESMLFLSAFIAVILIFSGITVKLAEKSIDFFSSYEAENISKGCEHVSGSAAANAGRAEIKIQCNGAKISGKSALIASDSNHYR